MYPVVAVSLFPHKYRVSSFFFVDWYRLQNTSNSLNLSEKIKHYNKMTYNNIVKTKPLHQADKNFEMQKNNFVLCIS